MTDVSLPQPPNKTFAGDLEYFAKRLEAKDPFGFSRFGDGELRILMGRGMDKRYLNEFRYAPGDRSYDTPRSLLVRGASNKNPNYCIGIPCPCCVSARAMESVRRLCQVPPGNLTWANLLVNANYPAFKSRIMPLFDGFEHVCVLHHRSGTTDRLPFHVDLALPVGTDAWRQDMGIIKTLKARISAMKTPGLFLFAAGPLANILVSELISFSPRHTYIDIGSVLDPWLFEGRDSCRRSYLRGEATLQRVCRW